MYSNSLFRDNVPIWMQKTCILLLLISQLMISGISSYTIIPITSFLGDEREFIQFTFYCGIVGSIAIYPIIIRLLRYFKRQNLLLVCILLELALCFLTVHCDNDLQIFIYNFLLSSIRMIVLITNIGLLMSAFNPKNSRGIFYGLYYSISFTFNQIYAYLVAMIILRHPWSEAFVIGIPGLVISLLIVLFLMHHKRLSKKYPLYQMDWVGYLLFLLFGFSLVFICVYGIKYYWIQGEVIQKLLLACVLALVLWIVRMYTVKRPFVDLRVLHKYVHIRMGVLFMVLLFIVYNTFSISTEYMKVNLTYTDEYVASSNLFMIIPFITVIPITGIWLHHKRRVREPLFIGFLLFTLYYFSTAGIFYPEQNHNFFVLPTILRAAAYGIILTSLSYYASVNVTSADNGHRAFFSIASRNVLALPITSAWWDVKFKDFKQSYITNISAKYLPESYQYQEVRKHALAAARVLGNGFADNAIATKSIQNTIYKSALLSAAQDIYYLLGIISLLLAIVVICVRVFNIHYNGKINNYPLIGIFWKK